MEKIITNQGKKKALIIAISEYDNLSKEKQLPFCKNDGEAIYQILQKQGYEILEDWKLIGKVTSDQLKDVIFDFFRKQAESKDTLLFYFSGHGIPDGSGNHYLATTDIDPDYPDDLGYSFSLLQEKVKMSVAKKVISILDCCFSGAIGVKGNQEDVAKSARSAMETTFKEGDGKCVLASSLADQASFKMKGGEPYSLFTYCLLEGLKGGSNGEAVNLEGYVTPYTLGNYVYDRITSIDRRQKPITKTEMSGEIILAKYPELIKRQEKELVRTSAPLTSSSSSNSNEEIRPILDSARKYYVKKDYKRADIFFERVLEIEPNHIEALNSKGISLYRLAEYEKAKGCFDKVLEVDPENIVALNNIEILGKKNDDSSQYIQKPLQQYRDKPAVNTESIIPSSNDADAFFKQGLALSDLGSYEEAIKCYDKALEIRPDFDSAWIDKASILNDLGSYEEAIKCYNKALEIRPNDAFAWLHKGSALSNLALSNLAHKLQRYEEAIKCYDKALEIRPNDADIWYDKGLALAELDKHEEAIKCYDKALEIRPDFDSAQKNKKYALDRLRFSEEMLNRYNEALEIKPNDAFAWQQKGGTLNDLGRYEEAIKCYDKALEIKPNDAFAWQQKGGTLNDLGRYEEAIKCYDKALEIKPKDFFIWLFKGSALSNLRRYEEAIKCYDKAIEINPEDKFVWQNIWDYKGSALSNLRRYEEAIKCYDKALEISPDSAGYRYLKGNVLRNLGRYEEAIKCYDKALEIRPDFDLAWNGKGVALYKLGKNKDAKESFKKARDLGYRS